MHNDPTKVVKVQTCKKLIIINGKPKKIKPNIHLGICYVKPKDSYDNIPPFFTETI